MRIGLEVFPRGSELERIFRQKNKLRKKAAAVAAAGGTQTGGRVRGARGSPSPRRRRQRLSSDRFSTGSLGSRTHDTADSRSLMDEDYDEDYDELSTDDDSMFSQSFFTLDSDASQTTWDESTMYTDALSSFNTMDDDSITTGFADYVKSKGTKGGKSSSSSTGQFLANLLNCSGPTSVSCGIDEDMPQSAMTTKPMPAPYADIDRVAEAVASMDIEEQRRAKEEDTDTPRAQGASASTAVSIQSIASMDTAERNNNRQAIGPDSVEESGEELTLENAAQSALGSPAEISSLEINSPLEGVRSSVTVLNEASPLATIKQRFAESQDVEEVDGARRRAQAEEGHEFTLEEHQSST